MDQLIWFDFSTFGYAGWLPVTQLELEILWTGSESMMEHEPEVVAGMMAITGGRLRREAREGRVTPEWVSTACMLMAMRGRLGLPLPAWSWEAV